MTFPQKPQVRPARPEFSSGPCPKRPGWSPEAVASRAWLGRSHRSAKPKAQIKDAIEATRRVLGIPADYLVGIVPASDTGAVELAMWSMLGARPVDMLVWESFGKAWASDAQKELALEDCRVLDAPYGALPDLSAVRPEADVVFTWNGTTSGVRVANGDWIATNRAGLTICDATSAAFAQPMDWDKLDVVTFSWQKALGGEAAHGMLVLSPRAVERLESYTPPRPLPKIFRVLKNGKVDRSIFEGATINTPSMWCVADYADALAWAEEIGGLDALIARADANAGALQDWIDATPWVENLAEDAATRSNTSVCLKVIDPEIATLSEDDQRAFLKAMTSLLEAEGVALDIGGYRNAPPGLRIWCGATIEAAEVRALTPWLDWAFASVRAERLAA